MGLSDFERDLTEEKSTRDSHRPRDEDGERKQRHRHHHRSQKHRERDEDEERRRRHKRHHDRGEDEDRHRRKRRRSSPAEPVKKAEDVPVDSVKVFDSDNDEEDEWVEKETLIAPPEEDILDQRDINQGEAKVERDAWMQQPSSLDIEVVASKKRKAPSSQFVGAKDNHDFRVHEGEVSQHLKDLEADLADSDDEARVTADTVKDEPAQHDVEYIFGDAGSAWRMTKLRGVYSTAKETGKGVDDVAMEKYGDLRLFDDARE